MTQSSMPYATVGSGHINQVLRNILGSALADSVVDAVDADGRINRRLVAAHDPGMAAACDRGLRWEILSWKMEVEERDAVLCVQAALNDVGTSFMLHHEMQSILHLAKLCQAEADAAGRVSLDSVRARLLAGGSALADSPSFLPLVHFVLEQGGCGDKGFIDPLVAFHEKFVNANVRRLRDHHFRAVCLLSQPLLRSALLKAAFGCPAEKIRDGFIDYFTAHAIEKLRAKLGAAGLLDRANDLLRRFHLEYRAAGAYTALSPGDVAVRLGRLDMELGRRARVSGS